jgi:mannose-6-phosphate isomerase-like protein (cupin superfamily)
MPHLVRTGQWTAGGTTGVDLIGSEHGSNVTLIIEEMPVGGRPRLHRHPYNEVWVVFSGRGRFTAGDEQLEAGPGDAVYVEAGVPHTFLSLGPEPLRMLCIHESPEFSTEWLEPRRA